MSRNLLDAYFTPPDLTRTRFIRGKKGTDTVAPAWFVWHSDDPSLAVVEAQSRRYVSFCDQMMKGQT